MRGRRLPDPAAAVRLLQPLRQCRSRLAERYGRNGRLPRRRRSAARTRSRVAGRRGARVAHCVHLLPFAVEAYVAGFPRHIVLQRAFTAAIFVRSLALAFIKIALLRCWLRPRRDIALGALHSGGITRHGDGSARLGRGRQRLRSCRQTPVETEVLGTNNAAAVILAAPGLEVASKRGPRKQLRVGQHQAGHKACLPVEACGRIQRGYTGGMIYGWAGG